MGVFHKPLVTAMTVALFVVFLAVLGHALPMDPRLDRPPRPGDDLHVPDINHPDVNQEHLRRPRMPDTPGLDPEEYYRYWQEMAKDNPGTSRIYKLVLISRRQMKTRSCQ